MFVMVGLPGSGKTVRARELGAEHGALVLTPDSWAISIFGSQDRHQEPGGMRWLLEGRLVGLAVEALRLGVSVVLDFGVWSRDERSALRWLAQAVGASCQIVYLPVEPDVQWQRIHDRWQSSPAENFPMYESELPGWSEAFEVPDVDERSGSALPDPPEGADSWLAWATQFWPSLAASLPELPDRSPEPVATSAHPTPAYPRRTERLVLRPLHEDDIDIIHAYRNDPDVAALQDWDLPMSREHVERHVAAQSGWSDIVPGAHRQIGIELDGELIGDLYVGLDEHGGVAEIGFTLRTEHQGKGYAFEAASAVVADLIERLGCHRIVGQLSPQNHRSARLLERLGMHVESLSPKSYWWRGTWDDNLIYAMSEADWRARQATATRPLP